MNFSISRFQFLFWETLQTLLPPISVQPVLIPQVEYAPTAPTVGCWQYCQDYQAGNIKLQSQHSLKTLNSSHFNLQWTYIGDQFGLAHSFLAFSSQDVDIVHFLMSCPIPTPSFESINLREVRRVHSWVNIFKPFLAPVELEEFILCLALVNSQKSLHLNFSTLKGGGPGVLFI